MKEYKIIEFGIDDKVLVEWDKSNDSAYQFVTGSDKEYSVHTKTENGIIWGHYYRKREDAEEYFSKYRRG